MRITVDGSFAVAVAGRLISQISASSPSSVPGPAMSSPACFEAPSSRNDPSWMT